MRQVPVHGTAKRRRYAFIVAAVALFLAATAASVVGCREDDGCGDEQSPSPGIFDDTPRPSLCFSDTLIITPSGASFDAGSGGSDPAGDAAVDAGLPVSSDFSVVGRRQSGQPHEYAHVDVYACSGTSSSIVLKAAKPGGTPGGCRQASVSLLDCLLDSDGMAAFSVALANPDVDALRTSERLCARSGNKSTNILLSLGGQTTLARVGILPAPDATLVTNPRLTCGANISSSADCSNVTSRGVTLIALTPPLSRPDGSPVFVSDPDASVPVTPSAAVDVDVSIVSTVGGDTSVWMSDKPECPRSPSHVAAHFNNSSPYSSRIYVCSSGVPGRATIVAGVGRGTLYPAPTAEVDLFPVPALLTIDPVGSSSSATDYQFTVKDCRGGLIDGAQVTVGGKTAIAAGGIASLSVPASDAGASVPQVGNPKLGGPAALCEIAIGGPR